MAFRSLAVATAILLISAGGSANSGRSVSTAQEEKVKATLDRWHKAASVADENTYFSLLTPDAVFLGTDATERWTREEFREYAHPHFARGKGWTFVPLRTHISISRDGKTAWFDEVLRSESYGECRGSGVLLLEKQKWRIAQYNLTIPIPNGLAKSIVAMIRNEKKP